MTPTDVSKYLQFLQGVVNDVAARMSDCLVDADKEMLELIQKELENWKPSSIRTAAKELEEISRKIEKLRRPAFAKAKTLLLADSEEVLAFSADLAATEIDQTLEEAWKASKEHDLAIRRKLFDSKISKRRGDEILDYAPFSSGGDTAATIDTWFKTWERNDLHRITGAVQKRMVEGLTLDGMIRKIKGYTDKSGTKHVGIVEVLRGYKDQFGVWHEGTVEVSRQSARTVARTLINGVANAGRMEMYQQNADVIDGVKWLATLDTRSCLQCAALDGRIWPPDQMDEVPRPPAHPNCRCAVVPYIDLGKEFEGNRPAEASRTAKFNLC